MAETLTTDILILGTGGAGLMAALHAFWADPSLDITLVSKGMLGESGCTRMVQGGYNVALDPNDSVQAHFEDTVRGGFFLNDQDLAWTLVEDAPRIVRELENKIGCLFDRAPDGRIHQKAFAGQTFDRTVHVGDLTGIEIMSRLREEGRGGAGAHLFNGQGERYMKRYDPEKMERATRDRVSRAAFVEIRDGRGTENGAVLIDVTHLGAEFVEKNFTGMRDRCLRI